MQAEVCRRQFGEAWAHAREALTELGFVAPLSGAVEHERAFHHELWRRARPNIVV